VEVILTDRWGQAGRGEFTYASPATFDFNGDWEGSAEAFPWEWGTRVVFSVSNFVRQSGIRAWVRTSRLRSWRR
jgi:hypothetical protein